MKIDLSKKVGILVVATFIVSLINLSAFASSATVSDSKSSISPQNQIVNISDGKKSNITVELLDNSGNPKEGHIVKLISSCDNDFVSPANNITDAYGKTVFDISSNATDICIYSAYDFTEDVVLKSKAKIAFVDSTYSVLSDDVSNYSYAATGSPSSPVDYFEFEDVPATIAVNESISFQITAYDALDQVVMDYNGTVKFQISSANAPFAVVPPNYTFTADDLGSHVFSLATTFKQTGAYTVVVSDVSNVNVFGEYNFTVGSENLTGGSAISITSPTSGTYSTNVQIISGKANAGANLKIYDNDSEVASLTANSSGSFTFTTAVLDDGVHEIYVAEVNEVGTIVDASDAVSITIDTAAPGTSEVMIEPSSTVDAGTPIRVKVSLEGKVETAKVILDGNIFDLTKSEQGFYDAQLTAPTDFGSYPLTFIVVDNLGNETQFNSNTPLIVEGGLIDDVTVIEDVKNLFARSGDKRVTLTWNKVKELSNPIQNYRVYYGLTPTQLVNAVDTFTPAETWYIPNLMNGVEYYFALVAVDSKGKISEHFSNIVSCTPEASGPILISGEPLGTDLGVSGQANINNMNKDVSETGPEMAWLLAGAILSAVLYGYFYQRKKLCFDKSRF
ncbi:MAG: fibronectin type III domain-containing protein [Candidatus Gracilibacteria bacterium]|jgi:hypothetical protein